MEPAGRVQNTTVGGKVPPAAPSNAGLLRGFDLVRRVRKKRDEKTKRVHSSKNRQLFFSAVVMLARWLFYTLLKSSCISPDIGEFQFYSVWILEVDGVVAFRVFRVFLRSTIEHGDPVWL